jgi:hypothetical protein
MPGLWCTACKVVHHAARGQARGPQGPDKAASPAQVRARRTKRAWTPINEPYSPERYAAQKRALLSKREPGGDRGRATPRSTTVSGCPSRPAPSASRPAAAGTDPRGAAARAGL